MRTVTLPTADAVQQFGPVPDGVTVLAWDGLADAPEGARDVQFFVGRYDAAPPRAQALADLPALEVVQLVSAGVEPWLPVVPPGVTLCNGRGVHGASTAELAFAGLLGVLRDLPGYRDAQGERRWERRDAPGVTGARLLVLGAGDIGARIATAAAAFDATTTLVGRTARDGVASLDDLPRLLPERDAVILALPLTPDTRGLVDAAFLAALPDGAVVVNVARGGVLDTDALLRELQAGRLRAFLDVTDPEPLPADHPLWSAPGLLLTPHVGGGVRGWERRAYGGLVRSQVERWLAGEPLANRVEHGY